MEVNSATRAAKEHDGNIAIHTAVRDDGCPRAGKAQWIALVVALLAALSMWYYVAGVLIPHQEAESGQTGHPRGNLSDLYPRWLGARELLLHGRDPYSADITRESQIGYWGRTVDPNNPNDPKDEARFAYPAYVIFLLAPLVGFSFHTARTIFATVLALATVASVLLWMRAFRLRTSLITVATISFAVVATFPLVQGFVLQQLTLLVAALLAGAAAALAGGYLALAGGLLAVATIKPHLAVPVVLWLIVWSVAEWRKRRSFVFGFGAVMIVLLIAAEFMLPGWFGRWRDSINAYLQYNQAEPLLFVAFGHRIGFVARYSLMALTAVIGWLRRGEAAGSTQFNFAWALILTANVLTTPVWHPYDQILLLPAALLVIFHWKLGLVFGGAARVIYTLAALVVGWGSMAAVALTILSVFSHSAALRLHLLPLYTVVLVPVAVLLALALPAFTLQSRTE